MAQTARGGLIDGEMVLDQNLESPTELLVGQRIDEAAAAAVGLLEPQGGQHAPVQRGGALADGEGLDVGDVADTTGAEVRAVTGFKGERDRIDFTAFGYVPRVEDEKRSDQRQLSYFLDTDPRTRTKSLVRREQPKLDDDFEEGGRVQTLLLDVRELEFQYWDPQKEDWAEKWDAAGTEQNRLPARVRIKIVAVMDDGREQTFTTQSKLWLLTPLTF